MLKRKIDIFLKQWKEKSDKNPLIISWARQIGKTTSIEEFAKTYKFIYRNKFYYNASI